MTASAASQGSNSPGRGGLNATSGEAMDAEALIHGDGGFRASEISFLQEQNNGVLAALENIESERDKLLLSVREWEEREQQMLV